MTFRLDKIANIIKQEWDTEKRYREMRKVLVDIYKADFFGDEEKKFIPTTKEVSTKNFVYKWSNWFGTRRIYWEDWSDICEEGLNLTLKFIESDFEDFKEITECKELIQKHFDRIDELQKSSKYTEEQKMAWNDMGY